MVAKDDTNNEKYDQLDPTAGVITIDLESEVEEEQESPKHSKSKFECLEDKINAMSVENVNKTLCFDIDPDEMEAIEALEQQAQDEEAEQNDEVVQVEEKKNETEEKGDDQEVMVVAEGTEGSIEDLDSLPDLEDVAIISAGKILNNDGDCEVEILREKKKEGSSRSTKEIKKLAHEYLRAKDPLPFVGEVFERFKRWLIMSLTNVPNANDGLVIKMADRIINEEYKRLQGKENEIEKGTLMAALEKPIKAPEIPCNVKWGAEKSETILAKYDPGSARAWMARETGDVREVKVQKNPAVEDNTRVEAFEPGYLVPSYPNKIKYPKTHSTISEKNKHQYPLKNFYLVTEVSSYYMLRPLLSWEKVVQLPTISDRNVKDFEIALSGLFEDRDVTKIPNAQDVIVLVGSFHSLERDSARSMIETILHKTGKSTVLWLQTDEPKATEASSYRQREKLTMFLATRLRTRMSRPKYRLLYSDKEVFCFPGGYRNLGPRIRGIKEASLSLFSSGLETLRLQAEDFFGINFVSALFSKDRAQLWRAHGEEIVLPRYASRSVHEAKRKRQWLDAQTRYESKILKWGEEALKAFQDEHEEQGGKQDPQHHVGGGSEKKRCISCQQVPHPSRACGHQPRGKGFGIPDAPNRALESLIQGEVGKVAERTER